MEEHHLKQFFGPSSVALVGATDDLGRFAGRVLLRMTQFGYQGRIFPVNPKFESVRGFACYPSIRDLPEAPDHVGIVVPAKAVMGVLEDCAARGARFATIYTGGFAESGTPEGRAMQAEITSFARRTGVRIMGPNCNGMVSFVDGFAMTTSATIAGPRKPAGNVGVVSQSGGAGQTNVMWRAQELGLGISYQVSCGNSADLNILDFMQFMIDDPTTSVVMVLAEHIPDGPRLMDVARRAAEREKPIVMVKLGRTEAGSQAAASHTGAMAGSDAVCDAVLRQCGIIRVDDCNELAEVAMVLRTKRWPRGARAGATTISGGNGVLLVDLGASVGIRFPEYSDKTQESLAAVLPKLATTGNPTDVTNAAIGKPEIFRRCIETIAGDENVDAVIPIFTMAQASDVRQAADAAKAVEKPVVLLWIGACNDDPAFTQKTLIESGVPVYRNTLGCLKAVRAAMRYGEFLMNRRGLPARPAGIDAEKARALLASTQGTLTERASKQIIGAYGIPCTGEALARNADEAVRIARDLDGPVAMKIESADIPHKTEAGAIRLTVAGEAAVRRAFDEVMQAARKYKPQAALDGVLVQAMVPAGTEIMLGVVVDPIYGPVVVAGLGGIHVEVLGDLAYRAAPVDGKEAQAMLRELRGYKLLEGVRGAAPRDVDALCEQIVRLSWLAHELRDEIAELDINPLVLRERGAGACAVDALVVTRAKAKA
ncbi:MAG: acetate--CoA ligase family protein [Betaproteobacteria bacterium]|nr:acetate--CoA ligase family protein [Betaproteobacteria bacterium]